MAEGRCILAAVKCIRRADEDCPSFIYNEQALNKFLTMNDKYGYFPHLIESVSDSHNYYLSSVRRLPLETI